MDSKAPVALLLVSYVFFVPFLLQFLCQPIVIFYFYSYVFGCNRRLIPSLEFLSPGLFHFCSSFRLFLSFPSFSHSNSFFISFSSYIFLLLLLLRLFISLSLSLIYISIYIYIYIYRYIPVYIVRRTMSCV